MTINCDNCPLRALDMFEPLSTDEVTFMKRFKTGELTAEPGTEILCEGNSSAQLYTALSGMGLRYKTLADGERQVIGFVMPGDFIGLQTGVMNEMGHSVEATTEMHLCVFNRSELWGLFKTHAQRAFDLTHLAAIEEHLLCEALVAVGQMDGVRKVAWLLHRFYRRLTALGMNRNDRVQLPYRQQDIADALGLSLVHTNKSLARLRNDGVATWTQGALVVHDVPRLTELAAAGPTPITPRPLI
ncbi:Crp/Fnr family transcriptional regulator [Antarctobacter jejuensis]|uniref:Crp/Fnr family transcriptional regulator n=1 Tax=Antarctobacter jejuensis TaxID=1439938 RepID=UPI003FD6B6B1